MIENYAKNVLLSLFYFSYKCLYPSAHLFVSACVCVCVRERERKSERKYFCVFIYVWLQNKLISSRQWDKTPPTSVLDMTLNNLMVRVQ